jgi:channel protein (hemolysin III family)
LTHLAGAVLSVAALVVLVWLAISARDARQLVAFTIFGISQIALFTASALYHSLPLSPAGVARLRRIDHMMVFVLIAGTYTPICLVALRGGWGWSLFGVVWGIALGGRLAARGRHHLQRRRGDLRAQAAQPHPRRLRRARPLASLRPRRERLLLLDDRAVCGMRSSK